MSDSRRTMADDTNIGAWAGPFVGELVGGGHVSPGDKLQVTEADLQSGHWDTSRAKNPTVPATPDLPPAVPDTVLPTDATGGGND